MIARAAPPIPSPCTGICTIDRHGLCRGCKRTLDEIAAWPTASEADRRAMMVRVRGR
ncbi:DUF1289 domain-containing protein [Novosphingobium lentum]|uniref:DUF1289 domain-containing protein n=1 Tax=Novosphingobium lentum TaxID=145287 RepID=UPI000A00AF60|nr:DUF1289 domain-containing protein [Novosphingobium lentum]